MSDNVSAAPVAAPEAAAPVDPNLPPHGNMTGAEARAWVDAQKAKEAAGHAPAGKPSSTADIMKDAAKEAKAASEKRKLKIDGEEVEVDVDEALREFTKGKSGDKKLAQAAAMRKQVEEFIKMMKDPEQAFEVLKKLGHDPRSLAERRIAAELEEELLDPREREFRTTKKELERLKQIEIRREQEANERRDAELKAKYAKDYSDQFVSALQDTGLPPTKPMVAEMAKYIQKAAKLNYRMTAKEAALLVKEDVQIAHQRLIGDADGEMLIKLLGEQVANKVRKWDTSRVKNPESGLRTPTEQGKIDQTRRRSRENKPMTPQEWRAFNRGQ